MQRSVKSRTACWLWLGMCLAVSTFGLPRSALAQHAEYDAMVATHARANGVPESLVHRVIRRESGYRPGIVSHGNIGMMQIKLATARGVGYTGTAEGLRDAETNLTYAVRYLAGAYRVANGNEDRAVHYYANGFYYALKRQRHHRRTYARADAQMSGMPLRLTPQP